MKTFDEVPSNITVNNYTEALAFAEDPDLCNHLAKLQGALYNVRLFDAQKQQSLNETRKQILLSLENNKKLMRTQEVENERLRQLIREREISLQSASDAWLKLQNMQNELTVKMQQELDQQEQITTTISHTKDNLEKIKTKRSVLDQDLHTLKIALHNLNDAYDVLKGEEFIKLTPLLSVLEQTSDEPLRYALHFRIGLHHKKKKNYNIAMHHFYMAYHGNKETYHCALHEMQLIAFHCSEDKSTHTMRQWLEKALEFKAKKDNLNVIFYSLLAIHASLPNESELAFQASYLAAFAYLSESTSLWFFATVMHQNMRSLQVGCHHEQYAKQANMLGEINKKIQKQKSLTSAQLLKECIEKCNDHPFIKAWLLFQQGNYHEALAIDHINMEAKHALYKEALVSDCLDAFWRKKTESHRLHRTISAATEEVEAQSEIAIK